MEDGGVEWVAEFYRKRYESADWRARWATFDPPRPDPRIDAIRRLVGNGPKRILELGPGTPARQRRHSPMRGTMSSTSPMTEAMLYLARFVPG